MEQIDADYKQSINTLKNHYNIFLYTKSMQADKIYKDIQNNNKLTSLIYKLSNNLTNLEYRTALHNILNNNILNSQINGLQIISPLNKSILRSFYPSKYNDNISRIRKDIVYVNKTKKKTFGFHSGRVKNGFRYIYPLFHIVNHKKIYIGALDISYSSDQLQHFLTNISKIHTHFLISKDIFYTLDRNIKDFNLYYATSAENNNALLKLTPKHPIGKCVLDNHVKLTKIQNIINEKMNTSKEFSVHNLHNSYNGKIKLISFYPIKNNIDNNIVSWLVSYEYNPHLKYLLSIQMTYYIIAFILVFFICYTIFHIIRGQIILEKLVLIKTKELQLSNKNLELIVNNKTKELISLNNSLEEKIIKEVNKSKYKDQQLLEQSKMAALGEMIANIAHQWRQPLSIISTSATGMKMFNEIGKLDSLKLNKNCDLINEHAQYLSNTIDDFKNFIQNKNIKKEFYLKDSISRLLLLMDGTFKSNHITTIINLKNNINLNSYENELIQCLINISNNSKDALLENNISNKLLFITIFKDKNNAIIKLYDNAGGIDNKIINKIFEPYFTTKHKTQGTGLGLHMTYNLIKNGIKGNIKVKNHTFTYNNIEYTGACFTIVISI